MKIRRLSAGLALVALAAPLAHAQTPPSGADLSLELSKAGTTPLVGDVFEQVFTVRNSGPSDAPSAGFTSYVGQELEVQALTSSGPDDVCGEDQPTYDEPPPPEAKPVAGGSSPERAPFNGALNCSLGTMTPGETATITMTLRRIGARESYASAWVSSYAEDPRYENNNADFLVEADRSNPVDVGILVQVPKETPVAAEFTYKITVANAGPSTADSTRLTLPAIYGLDLHSVKPARAEDLCTIAETSDVDCHLGPLSPGDSALIEVVAQRTSAYEIWGSAWLQTSGFDETYDNDYASFYLTADPSVTSDLSVLMTGPADTPLVGESFPFEIKVENAGPSAAGDVWLSDYLPPGVRFVSAAPEGACSHEDHARYPMADAPAVAEPGPKGDAYYPIAPGGLFCDLGSIPAADSKSLTVTVERTSAQEIWNSAWISSSNHDPNYENNYADVQLGPDKSNPADVSVAIETPARPENGSTFDIALTVTNSGPSSAGAVTLTNALPYGTELAGLSSEACTYSGDSGPPPAEISRPFFYRSHEVTCNLGTLAAGDKSSVVISVTRTSEYEMWNSAWVTTSSYDASYENDYASALIEGKAYGGDCTSNGTAEGTKGSDTIVVGDCFVDSKAGADSVEMVPGSAPGDARVRTGAGGDSVNLNLSVGSATRRTIRIDSGRGADSITLTVAPGAGNATILVDAGAGRDRVLIDAPAGVRGLRIVIIGGDGDDSVLWTGSRTPTSVYGVPRLRVRGGAGNDLVEGGYSDDRLHGNGGRDQLYGSLGDDSLRGGSGDDVCRGGPGSDSRVSC